LFKRVKRTGVTGPLRNQCLKQLHGACDIAYADARACQCRYRCRRAVSPNKPRFEEGGRSLRIAGFHAQQRKLSPTWNKGQTQRDRGEPKRNDGKAGVQYGRTISHGSVTMLVRSNVPT
jgi:hypothetical protein